MCLFFDIIFENKKKKNGTNSAIMSKFYRRSMTKEQVKIQMKYDKFSKLVYEDEYRLRYSVGSSSCYYYNTSKNRTDPSYLTFFFKKRPYSKKERLTGKASLIEKEELVSISDDFDMSYLENE